MKKTWETILMVEVINMMPTVICPECSKEEKLENVLTAQSNQNVIFKCPHCQLLVRNIKTSKG
ncbi:hypothetical protein [Niallia circulans]|uniref:hypothetical protein n=1 Tax=Niallia circulans TaxID=1397 RepID=UPI001140436D|nr:hypothetical protein [Niallia circulans]